MSIALDVMGGDHAPGEIIVGALQAAPLLHRDLILVGPPEEIKKHLPAGSPKNVRIKPASQWVEMHEKPLDAYKKKKDSSIMVGVRLVKEGEAQAFVSAGNTGACTATAHLVWRQLAGLHRPAIASPMPNKHGGFVILDTGASPDVDPEHLVEFALMGRAYAQQIMGRPNPRVHLLNIGEEEGKGNAFVKEVYKLMKEHPWFEGNIEGKDVYMHPCDVVVCDAFVGNVFLKTSEGIAELIVSTIRDGVPKEPWKKWMYAPLRGLMAPLRKQMDYAETGGSPLLGLNGLCTICHGRSNAKAIKNALLMTQKGIENRLVDTLRESVVQELGSK
ncbi:MAG TPA: phosphate acyltransferase PlsX [Fimbriimonas sp.]|nr:phosphate acyltransferase PlsX [Fimbriimonas sp.]